MNRRKFTSTPFALFDRTFCRSSVFAVVTVNGIDDNNVRFVVFRGNDSHVYFLLGSILVDVESVSIAVR